MLHLLKTLLYSGNVTNLLLFLLAFLYGAATFVEHQYGVAIARQYFYNNPLIFILLFLAVVNLCGVLIKRKYIRIRKMGMLLFHVAFLFILAGAWITHCWSYEGIMHIREGEHADMIYLSDNRNEIHQVPFSVKLNNFAIHRYPGSQSPSSYESDLLISSKGESRREILSMNKVIHEQGFRLYQSSYDPDEQGTVLIVNYDPVGAAVSYLGYFLMFAGILWILLSKGSRFGYLRAELKKITTVVMLCWGLSPLFSGSLLSAQERYDQTHLQNEIDRFIPSVEHADKFGELIVQCNSGRAEPVNTYASKLLRKIYRENSFEGYRAEQVMLGLILYPDYWNQIALIAQDNAAIHELLGTSGTHIPYYALFDQNGDYKLQRIVEQVYKKSNKERSKLDKDLLKLDERLNIVYALQQGDYLALFPLEKERTGRWFSPGEDLSSFGGKDSMFVSKIFPWYLSELDRGIQQGEWKQADEIVGMLSTYQKAKSTPGLIDEGKIKAELLYNRMNIFGRSAIFYLAFSTFLLLFSLLGLMTPHSIFSFLIKGSCFAVLLVFITQTAGIALRWYISGQAPWSNAYESMVYVGWSAVFAGLFFMRRSPLTFGLAGLLAGFILLVSNFNFMDPEITPLVPVLKSPWLMFHVAVIMASYGFFGMSFLLSLFSMSASLSSRSNRFRHKLKELRLMNELSLIIGLCLLSAGTFLGAIWANESWGRYWGWDPKEVWALVTMLVYAFVTHSHRIRGLKSDFAFNTMTLLAFASVLMTYFGVNYYLSGLHSYGKTDTPAILNLIYAIYGAILILIAAAFRKKEKHDEEVTSFVDENNAALSRMQRQI